MPAALALNADRPAPRRRAPLLPWILLGSVGLHLLVLAAMALGVPVMPPLVEPPTITMQLLGAVTAPPAPQKADVRPRAAASAPLGPGRPSVSPAAPSRPAAVTAPLAPSAPSASAGAIAPPGFKARGLTGGGDALRETARSGIGCRNADVLALTKAEQAVCDEALGEKNKNRPAMYAVIDPAKKAAFDGACKKDDDWCLYRAGKGPYPGLLALGRKKKIKGWD